MKRIKLRVVKEKIPYEKQRPKKEESQKNRFVKRIVSAARLHPADRNGLIKEITAILAEFETEATAAFIRSVIEEGKQKTFELLITPENDPNFTAKSLILASEGINLSKRGTPEFVRELGGWITQNF